MKLPRSFVLVDDDPKNKIKYKLQKKNKKIDKISLQLLSLTKIKREQFHHLI